MSRKMPERRSLAQSGLGKRCTVIAGEIDPVSLSRIPQMDQLSATHLA